VTVYIDDMRMAATVGPINARWSHLMADTDDELHAFAGILGLKRSSVRFRGTWKSRYEVTESARRRAIQLGAVPIGYGSDEFLEFLHRKQQREPAQIMPKRSAIRLIRRIRDHFARAYVLVSHDDVNHVRAQAVCSCKWRAQPRNDVIPGNAIQLAKDDAFSHHCTTGHRLSTARVRGLSTTRGRPTTWMSDQQQIVPITAHSRW
jgi:hypothetical protein